MNNSRPEPLIQIGKQKNVDFISKLAVGFVADKFFVSGAVFSILGIGWLGSHLWLRLRGEMAIGQDFAQLRQLHILIQVYLFFGLFILGFVAQAAPKLSGVTAQASGKTLLWIPTIAIGVIAWQISPQLAWGKFIIAATFISALFYLVSFFKQAKNPPINVGLWLVFGLIAFAASPFIETQNPTGALLVFWLSIFPIIIGVSQQFVVGFLNGTKIPLARSYLLFALYLLGTAVALAFYSNPTNQGLAKIWGLLAALLLCTHLYFTAYGKSAQAMFNNPLALAFLLGFFWAFVGAIHLTFYGPLYIDMTLHLWAIGWASSLVIGVSMQILSYMCEKPGTLKRSTVAMLLLWQVVAFSRGTSHIFALPGAFAWILLTAVTIVIISWTAALFYFEWKILKKAALLRANSKM